MRYSSHLLVRVPPSLPERVKAVAAAEGLDKSKFVRLAIESALAKRARLATRQARP